MKLIQLLRILFMVIIFSSGCCAVLDESKKVANLTAIMSPHVSNERLDSMLYKLEVVSVTPSPYVQKPMVTQTTIPQPATSQQVAPIIMYPVAVPHFLPARYGHNNFYLDYDYFNYGRYGYGHRQDRWDDNYVKPHNYIEPGDAAEPRVKQLHDIEEHGIKFLTKVICGTVISGALCYFLYQRYYKKPFADDKRCLDRAIRIYQESPEILPTASHPILEEAIKRYSLMGRRELRDICGQLRDLTNE